MQKIAIGQDNNEHETGTRIKSRMVVKKLKFFFFTQLKCLDKNSLRLKILFLLQP